MQRSLICKLNLLLYGCRFYKKSDLELLHRRFKISDQQYNEFSLSIRTILEPYPQFHFVADQLNDYKAYIVCE